MTSIEWTDETWNPFKGCSRVSPGCDNCYAMLMAHRFPWGEGLTRIRKKDRQVDWSGTVRFYEEELARPLRWRKARRVFVCSGSDIFHESNAFEQIAAVFGVMASCPRHTFQVLTKRPIRAAAFFTWVAARGESDMAQHSVCLIEAVAHGLGHKLAEDAHVRVETAPVAAWPLPNVWVGVSAEDQQRWDERVPILLEDVPAAVRFVSAEPLLGPIGFADVDRTAIDWIIVGGESGRGARPLDLRWVEDIIHMSAYKGIACFVKQLGHHPRIGPDARFSPPLTGKGGDPREWPPHLRVRQWPADPPAQEFA